MSGTTAAAAAIIKTAADAAQRVIFTMASPKKRVNESGEPGPHARHGRSGRLKPGNAFVGLFPGFKGRHANGVWRKKQSKPARIERKLAGIILYGTRTLEGWQFNQSYADQTGLLMDEPGIRREVGSLPNWEAALTALDGENWHRLPGVMVHPDFRERVWAAIQSRLAEDTTMPRFKKDRMLARWRDRCRVSDL